MHETSYTYTAKTFEIYSMMQNNKKNVTTNIINKALIKQKKEFRTEKFQKKGTLKWTLQKNLNLDNSIFMLFAKEMNKWEKSTNG